MNLPLHGLRVLCLARMLPGAYCTLLLADMGADVTMIEHPVGGDQMRLHPTMFSATCRGKRSIAIDLRSDKGIEVCRKIAEQSDVVVEGFRPGVAAR